MSNALHSTHSYGNEEASTLKGFTLPQTGGDMSGRLEDLARREQELAARETALNAKAEHIRKVRRSRGSRPGSRDAARAEQLAAVHAPYLPRHRHGDP